MCQHVPLEGRRVRDAVGVGAGICHEAPAALLAVLVVPRRLLFGLLLLLFLGLSLVLSLPHRQARRLLRPLLYHITTGSGRGQERDETGSVAQAASTGGTKQGNTRQAGITAGSEPYLQELLVLVLLLPPHRVEHAEARAAVAGVAVQAGGLGRRAHAHHAHGGVLEEAQPLRGDRKGGIGRGVRGLDGASILRKQKAGEGPIYCVRVRPEKGLHVDGALSAGPGQGSDRGKGSTSGALRSVPCAIR